MSQPRNGAGGPGDSGTGALPGFAVVSMMREDPAVIRRFIDFYLRAGAEHVLIFHDGPLAGREGLEQPGVILTECDAAFWAALCGSRPKVHEAAQTAVFNAAWAACRNDWLLVVDADEFVLGSRPIRALLASVPAAVDALRIPTAEAVWGPGDDLDQAFGCTHFRTALPQRGSDLMARLLYGKMAPLFRFGLLGHVAGKHFVRCGGRISQVRLHDSALDGHPVGRWAADLAPHNRDFVVAHFDAISFERWREKWRRRFSGEVDAREMGEKRLVQMRLIETELASGDVAARKLFARLNGLTPIQCILLARLGRLQRHDVFAPAMNRH